MRINNKLIILITLVLSTSYIFGIDYYDRKEIKVKTLYEKVALADVTYTEISSSFRGIKENESLNKSELGFKHGQIVHELAHEENCSKLCTQIHSVYCESEFIEEEEAREIRVAWRETATPYRLSIKTQKDIGYNTYYKIEIKGLEDTRQIDHLRSRTMQLLEKWDVKSKETLYFKGTIQGSINRGERQALVNNLLEKLNAKETGYYQNDYSEDTEAYYAYTKAIKDYILDQDNKKTNIQINFSYNEIQHKTHMIIAFPFYNESF